MSRHHHHDPAPPPCCSCCACACGCSPPAPAPAPCGYYAVPPPQPAPGSDQLLHAIAAHLLLSSAPPPPPQPQAQPPPQHQPHPQPQHQPQPHPQPPPNPAAHHANLYASYAYKHQHQQGSAPHAAYAQPPAAAPAPPPQHQHQPNPPDHGQLLLHSLLRRVAALETTLPHVFPSPPAPHPQQPNPRRHHRAGAHQEDPRSRSRSPSPPPRRARRGQQPPTERELAARTIQEHFRRFLARRSRTLRQLKELAMLRSKAASLRASLSGSGRRRCKDPMAVSEAALGMLYRLDGIQGGDPMIREGKHAVSRELGRILEFVDKVLLREQEEMGVDGAFDDYPEGCHGMNRPTANRKVSFRGNEANTEADESSSSTEADETKAANSKKSANGKPGFAAPVPVHMESRRSAGEM